jgi:hypothetical protein
MGNLRDIRCDLLSVLCVNGHLRDIIRRVGQNRIFTPYMTVYFLWFPCQKYLKTPYIYGSGQP